MVETDILNQVGAYDLARIAGSTGPVLNRLFERGFHMAKRHTSTGISKGNVSVGNVCVDLAERILVSVEVVASDWFGGSC